MAKLSCQHEGSRNTKQSQSLAHNISALLCTAPTNTTKPVTFTDAQNTTATQSQHLAHVQVAAIHVYMYILAGSVVDRPLD